MALFFATREGDTALGRRAAIDGVQRTMVAPNVPTIHRSEMCQVTPLPGWVGRFFHTETMTFAHYDISADATPLHKHHHPEEEVWNVVSGWVLLTIDGVEVKLGPGSVAAIPPNTPHSARPLDACTAIIVDSPRRTVLPGVSRDVVVPDLASR